MVNVKAAPEDGITKEEMEGTAPTTPPKKSRNACECYD
jgi:hypothetical protein